MRRNLTRERLQDLMKELARSAPRGRAYRVFLVGGAGRLSSRLSTAFWLGSEAELESSSPRLRGEHAAASRGGG